MYHFLALFLRNPPITSRRSVLSQPLASASTTKFFRNEVGFSPTFLTNDFGGDNGFTSFRLFFYHPFSHLPFSFHCLILDIIILIYCDFSAQLKTLGISTSWFILTTTATVI